MCTVFSLSDSNVEKCFISHHIRLEWILSFAFAIGAFVLLTLTVLLLITSQYSRRTIAEYGRFTGFIASRHFSIPFRWICCLWIFLSDLFMSFNHSFSTWIQFGDHWWCSISIAFRLSDRIKLYYFYLCNLVNHCVDFTSWKNVSTYFDCLTNNEMFFFESFTDILIFLMLFFVFVILLSSYSHKDYI